MKPIQNCIGFGKAATGQTYPAIYTSAKIDGVRGIFRSDDQGATWIRINDDQHQYAWTGKVITGDPRIYGRVYFGTNGRGIIYGDIKSAARMITPSIVNSGKLQLNISPNPSNGQQITLNYSGDKGSAMKLRITDGNGRMIYIRNMSSTDFSRNTSVVRFPQKLIEGVYYVTISSGGQTTTTKLVVAAK